MECTAAVVGNGGSSHRQFQLLIKWNIFNDLWMAVLQEYDDLHGLELQRQATDGAMTGEPVAGKKTSPSPTDRAKEGAKCGLLTGGRGVRVQPVERHLKLPVLSGFCLPILRSFYVLVSI